MMIYLHSNDDQYCEVYAHEEDAIKAAHSLTDSDQKWVVSERKIRAGGAAWTVYVVHAR